MAVTYRGVNLHNGPHWHFDLVRGLVEPSDVRGKDTTAPGRPGQHRGNRVPHERRILLEGYVRGVGADRAERAVAFHEALLTVMAAFDLSLNPGTLTVAPGTDDVPYLGLAGTWSITARTVNLMPGPVINRMSFQEWSIELQSILPEWTPPEPEE